jgi:hypothetical protein
MKSQSLNTWKNRFRLLVAVLVVLPAVVITGCSPHLKAEDRKRDIEFLAHWARDYSPFVELNEKLKGYPGYKSLKPQYVQLAEEAESNKEFLQVTYGYFSLIGQSGHAYLIPEIMLFYLQLRALFDKQSEISSGQYQKAAYWAKLFYQDSFVHPPFPIVCREDKYFTDNQWRYKDKTVPRGSQILKVNGMTCSSYFNYIKHNTWLRYLPHDVDWIKEDLLVVNEGEDFRGWDVDFLLPDETIHHAFVPAGKGLDSPFLRLSFWLKRKDNCICVELRDDVGYIRVKSFSGFGKFIEQDRKKIKKFFENAGGKYTKLIIDVRNNSGGIPYYWADNLVRPFLDETIRYKHVTGVKRKFITDKKQSELERLQMGASRFAYEESIKEIDPPQGFDGKEWIFYEITRKMEPQNRYNFKGDIFILIDEGCGSATDDYANAVKRMGCAKLVGRNTGGGAAGYFPMITVRLPASGMIFILEPDLVINPDGSVDELFGTAPDVVLPPAQLPTSFTREELLKDEWIKKVITDL